MSCIPRPRATTTLSVAAAIALLIAAAQQIAPSDWAETARPTVIIPGEAIAAEGDLPLGQIGFTLPVLPWIDGW